MKQLLMLLLGVLALSAGMPRASVANESTGMQFLLTGPSAHSMGISEAHTASLSGSSAIFLNPAMLSREQQSSATLSYMLWPATDTQNSFAGVILRRENDAFGAAFLSSLVDDIPFRSRPSTEPDGSFAIRYFAVAASYARNIGPFSAGVTGMYLHEQFFQQDASGVGLNAGISYTMLQDRLTLASSLRNVGSMNDLDNTATRLPTLLSFGTDIQLIQFSTSAFEDEIPLVISLMADYNIPVNETGGADESISAQDDGYFNAGLEINLSNLIDIRAGYRTGDTQRRFSFGAGLLVNEFYFNYAFMPYETGFGTAHAVSLQYYF
ncbi:PorV/PorQ family protein [Balneolales bacterium ANBcel1]|nr:PorV/PorQ family protein [Balneolales bacterium ANBcel1]